MRPAVPASRGKIGPHFPELIGWAVFVISKKGCYLDYPIASLIAWLLPPARLHQFHVFANSQGRVLGYMTWALLAPDTESQWIAQRAKSWHLSEWCEGDRLWVIDFVALPGTIRECIRQAWNLPLGCDQVRYLRRRHEGRTRLTVLTRTAAGRIILRREPPEQPYPMDDGSSEQEARDSDTQVAFRVRG